MKNRIFLFIFRFVFLFFILSFGIRTLFVLWNFSVLKQESLNEIFFSFFNGMRFDLIVITALSLPFILLSFLPFPIQYEKLYKRILKNLFFWPASIYLALNIIDVEFWAFTSRRVTKDVAHLFPEIPDKIEIFIWTYWPLVFILFISLFLLWKFYPESKKNLSYSTVSWRTSVRVLGLIVCLILFLAISLRGGFQPKPLTLRYGNHFRSPILNVLHMNSGFTLAYSFYRKSIQPVSFFKDESEVITLITQKDEGYQIPIEPIRTEKDNIVVFIMESFATEYTGFPNSYKGYTPFFDSLAEKSVYFKSSFANGNRSIDGVVSVLAGIPSLMSDTFLSSSYQSTQIPLIGKILKNKGYYTSFFHGGRKGTLYFDSFSEAVGFDKYFYCEICTTCSKEQDSYGWWGCRDYPFLQFMAQELKKMPQPFFASHFTLTSHHPFDFEEKLKGQFPKGDLPIHESIGYADFALQEFFKQIENEPWFKNTLFIFTSDHTQKSSVSYYSNMIGKFQVPIFLYHPGRDLSLLNTEDPVQHVDIFDTILDYTGSQEENYLRFGRSLLKKYKDPFIVYYLLGRYFLIARDYFIEMKEGTWEVSMYSRSDRDQKNPLSEPKDRKDALALKLKAYVQYFNNGFIKNKFKY